MKISNYIFVAVFMVVSATSVFSATAMYMGPVPVYMDSLEDEVDRCNTMPINELKERCRNLIKSKQVTIEDCFCCSSCCCIDCCCIDCCCPCCCNNTVQKIKSLTKTLEELRRTLQYELALVGYAPDGRTKRHLALIMLQFEETQKDIYKHRCILYACAGTTCSMAALCCCLMQ